MSRSAKWGIWVRRSEDMGLRGGRYGCDGNKTIGVMAITPRCDVHHTIGAFCHTYRSDYQHRYKSVVKDVPDFDDSTAINLSNCYFDMLVVK